MSRKRSHLQAFVCNRSPGPFQYFTVESLPAAIHVGRLYAEDEEFHGGMIHNIVFKRRNHSS